MISPVELLPLDPEAALGYLQRADQRLREHPQLRAFIAECIGIIAAVRWGHEADTVHQLLEAGLIRRLLALPSVVTLAIEKRLDQIEYIRHALDDYLWESEEIDGELNYVVQHDFVRDLRTALLARRAAWKQSLRDRLSREGRTAEILTSIVWNPQNMARHLANCKNQKEEDYLFACFVTEGS